VTAFNTIIDYRGWQIESDADGHVTVWDSEGCEHWTEPSVDQAKATIDGMYAPAPMVGVLLLDARRRLMEGGPR